MHDITNIFFHFNLSTDLYNGKFNKQNKMLWKLKKRHLFMFSSIFKIYKWKKVFFEIDDFVDDFDGVHSASGSAERFMLEFSQKCRREAMLFPLQWNGIDHKILLLLKHPLSPKFHKYLQKIAAIPRAASFWSDRG